MKLIIHRNPEPEPYVQRIIGLKENIDWIKSLAELDDEIIDYIHIAKSNRHICVVGILGLTNFGAIAQFGYGINYFEIGKILYRIFEEKETASLFPFRNLTIIPYDLNPDYYLNNIKYAKKHNSIEGLGYSTNEIDIFVDDCFKSEIELVKKGEIFFNFKDLGFDAIDYYYSVLRYVTKNKHINLTVHIESINNVEFLRDNEMLSVKTRQVNRNYRLSQRNIIETWKQIEEDNKLNSWYQRGLKRKKAIQEYRAINKNELEQIRSEMSEELKLLSTLEKAKMIIDEKKFPPEYFPVEWSNQIIEDYANIPNSIKQELYNKLSIRVHNSKWKKLSAKLKNDAEIK